MLATRVYSYLYIDLHLKVIVDTTCSVLSCLWILVPLFYSPCFVCLCQ